MKEKIALFFLMIVALAGIVRPAYSGTEIPPTREFKVTLLFTEGGGGHKSAMAAVEAALESYPERPSNVKVKIQKVDPLMAYLPGQIITQVWDTSFENGYYDLLAPGFFAKDVLENHVGPAFWAADQFFRTGQMRRVANLDPQLLESLILKEGRPDMIVSVINSGNASYLKFAQEHNIPFRIVFTDYKIDTFVDGIGLGGEKFSRKVLEAYAPSDAPEIIEELEKRNIPYVVTGYPISPAFNQFAAELKQGEVDAVSKVLALLDQYDVEADDSVLFIMMGAKGFDKNATIKYIEAIRDYASFLHKSGSTLHVFLAAGQNGRLRKFGNAVAAGNHDGFVFHSLDNLNSDQVTAFMGIHHVGVPFLMFTKPGGSTVGQVEAMGIPALYSLNPIGHERFNAELMKRKNYAETIDMVHRAMFLHPQKMTELGTQVLQEQLQNASEQGGRVLGQVVSQAPWIGAVPAQWPVPWLHQMAHQTAENVARAVAPPIGRTNRTLLENLPPEITNQDVIDSQKFITLLRKFLVEGRRLASPPPNRFAETIAPIIYKDLCASQSWEQGM